VRGIFAAMQDTAVKPWDAAFLYAAIEHFRKPVSSEMSLTATPESRSNLAVAPGGDEFDAEAGELRRELDEAGFVGDAEDGALDFVSAAGHDRPRI